jgi:small subunit ribosomal protein S17
MSEEQKVERVVTGRVTSNKMDKTLTVLIERRVRHPIYGKYVRRSTKLHVHDENNEGRIGDTVQVTACRPMSRSKAWRLLKVVERAPE